MTTFFSVTSHIGDAKIANAVALNQQVGITHLAVGDGNGQSITPTKDKTALANETYRAQVSSLVVDDANPNYFIATLVIPPEIGGFTIREAAVFTQDGALFAVSNFPETYKPNLPEGGVGELTVQFYFAVVSPEAVKIVVDPYVTIATRQWVAANFVEKQHQRYVTLTSGTVLTSGRRFTPDNANAACSYELPSQPADGSFIEWVASPTPFSQHKMTITCSDKPAMGSTAPIDISTDDVGGGFVFHQSVNEWRVFTTLKTGVTA